MRLPGPPTTTLISVPAAVEDGVPVVAVAVGDPVVVEAAPPVAAALNAAILSPGLIAKTIPALQWVPCLQYTHTGSVVETVNSAAGKPSVTPSATGMLMGYENSELCRTLIKMYALAGVKSTGSLDTRVIEGGLGCGVIFLLEDKPDSVARCSSLRQEVKRE